MNDMLIQGFLEKVSWHKSGMRREIKEITKGLLSNKAIKRIIKNFSRKTPVFKSGDERLFFEGK